MATDIESHLNERRVFPPPSDFAAQARLRSMDEYERLRKWALDDPEGFWSEQARALEWSTPWHTFFETRTRRPTLGEPSSRNAASGAPPKL